MELYFFFFCAPPPPHTNSFCASSPTVVLASGGVEGLPVMVVAKVISHILSIMVTEETAKADAATAALAGLPRK